MTLDPKMFTQQALGQTQLIPDPNNQFIIQVCTLLGASADAGASPALSQAGGVSAFSVQIPNVAATTPYTFVTTDKIEIIDVTVLKSGAGAGNTIQVQDGSNNAISDAIVAAVDKAVTRAGTLDTAFRTIAAGGSFKVVSTYAAGSTLAEVNVIVRRR